MECRTLSANILTLPLEQACQEDSIDSFQPKFLKSVSSMDKYKALPVKDRRLVGFGMTLGCLWDESGMNMR